MGLTATDGDQGDTGNQGEQGESGESADAASLDFSTLASYFGEDTRCPCVFDVAFLTIILQQILIVSSGFNA